MTTVQNLPEEVLRMIFKQIDRETLANCTYVSKSWHLPAIAVFLSFVKLRNLSQIKGFITFIDKHSTSLYTNAISRISIGLFGNEEILYLDSTYVSTLFLRFPNLIEVVLSVSVSVSKMNDDICRSIIDGCPKLNSFIVAFNHTTFPEELYKVRLLLTAVDGNGLDNPSELPRVDLVTYLCSFPRLQSNDCFYGKYIDSLWKVVCMVEKLPYLTKVTMGAAEDKHNLADKHLTAKPKEMRDLIVSRLARVNQLKVYGQTKPIFPSSVNFIAKYMTGIERIYLDEVNDDVYWDSEERKHYYDNVLMDVFQRCPFINARIEFDHLRNLSECFETIVKKLFTKSDQYKRKNILCLTITEHGSNYIEIFANDKYMEISIEIGGLLCFHDIVCSLFDNDEVSNAQELVIRFPQHLYNPYCTDFRSYNIIIRSVQFIEKLSLDLSDMTVVSKFRTDEVEPRTLPNLKEIAISGPLHPMFQRVFSKFGDATPSLRKLAFRHWSGYLEPEIGEFQIRLPKYSLSHLSVNALPILQKTLEKKLDEQGPPTNEYFFALRVETLNTNSLKHFKVSYNRDGLSIASINCGDLEGYILGEDFLRMDIIVHSVEKLSITYINRETFQFAETACIIQET